MKHKGSVYIIGDVHGHLATLIALLNKIPANARIIFTGDLMDRGPESKGVIELLIENGYESILGNHDYEFLHYRRDKKTGAPLIYMDLLHSGYSQMSTINSYIRDVQFNLEEYEEHLDFVRKFPLFKYIEFEDENVLPLVVSHSFILPYWRGPDTLLQPIEIERVLLRHMNNKSGNVKYINDDFTHTGVFNVMGHSHFKEVVLADNFAIVDTGACYKNKLSALKYPEMEIISQDFKG